VSIQESKAFTANIEPGRRSRGRRAVTSGDLVAPNEGPARDLAPARHAARGAHGVKAPEVQEGEQT
jgi:hypothetical protein